MDKIQGAKNNLRFEVLDSSKYNPNYPPLSVIDQSPMFNDLVKKNRKKAEKETI